MCVILHLPPKRTISKVQLETCYNNNPDGWGIMFAKDGKLTTFKAVSNFKDFYKVFKDIPEDAERGLHFRIRTAGTVAYINCHPFHPTSNISFMHNGHIPKQPIDTIKSDTNQFCENDLKPLMSVWKDCLKDPLFFKLMDDSDLTGYSRLLFMDNEGTTLKTSLRSWCEREGISYSNGGNFYYRRINDNYNYPARSSTHTGGSKYPYSEFNDKDDYYDTVTNPYNAPLPENMKDNKSEYPLLSNRGNSTGGRYDVLKRTETDIKDDIGTNEKTRFIREKEAMRIANELDEEDLGRRINNILGKDQDAVGGEQPSFMHILKNTQEAEEIELEDGDETLDNEDPGMVLDIIHLTGMGLEDLMDFIQDYPKSAALTIQDLIRQGFESGVYDTVPVGEVESAAKA